MSASIFPQALTCNLRRTILYFSRASKDNFSIRVPLESLVGQSDSSRDTNNSQGSERSSFQFHRKSFGQHDLVADHLTLGEPEAKGNSPESAMCGKSVHGNFWTCRNEASSVLAINVGCVEGTDPRIRLRS